jgi:hypothetical protein
MLSRFSLRRNNIPDVIRRIGVESSVYSDQEGTTMRTALTQAWAAIKPYLKSVAAFVAAVATNVAANLTDGGAAWPQSGGEWARTLGTTALSTYLVWQTPNGKRRPRRRRKTAPKTTPAT